MNKSIATIFIILSTFTTIFAQIRDAKEVQEARQRSIKARAEKVYYTKKFDLSGLPEYKPEQQVSGTIRQCGSNYIADSQLQKLWEDGFRKHHPNIKFEDNLQSTFIAMSCLYNQTTDLAPMGRRPSWEESMAYQRIFSKAPLEITMATGSYNVNGWTFALAVFVHKDNPINKLTLKQLDGIFGAARSGGWVGTEWHKEVARTAKDNIRTWGQLGLKGEWKNKPINVYGYNLNFHFPRDFAEKVFGGGYMWNENLREYANEAKPDGSELLSAGEQFMLDLEKDKYGIAYAGILYQKPNTKVLALAENDKSPFVELTLESVQNRTYPLSREVYYYLNQENGKPLEPKLKEFLRYILSREGQEAIQTDGKYLPLTAEVVREQLKKLQ